MKDRRHPSLPDQSILIFQIFLGAVGLFLAVRAVLYPTPDPKHIAASAITLLTLVSLAAIAAAWALLRQLSWGHSLNLPWIIFATAIIALNVKEHAIGIPGIWTCTPPIQVEQAAIVLFGIYYFLREARKGFKISRLNQASRG